jgi:hypothetical protein
VLVEQFQFLVRFFTPRTVFMHLGAGDCSLALRAASYVERVHALDASREVLSRLRLPCNLRLASALPEDASIDVALGNREKCGAALDGIYRSLARGGSYFCTGPVRQTRRRLLDAGFARVRFYAGTLRISYASALLLEPWMELRIGGEK